MLRRRLRHDERGFTLIELMIVVVILGILTTIAIPSYMSFKGRAQDSANKANVRTALNAVESFYQDNSTYSGMTLAALAASYDQALDVAKFTLANVSATMYCIQSPQGSAAHTWRKNGPAALLEQNHC
jgi:type IV pilus assembly protein PilA